MTTYQKASLISVDEAIARGRQMLLLPRIVMLVGLILFLLPVALFIMAMIEGPVFKTNVWLGFSGVILFCFVVFFYLPFLFWSKRTTRWKLWAFGNVDNVHELKIMAVQANLCPVYGSVMDKLQIQSTEEREQWRMLQDRFTFPEVFKDNPDIPATTQIFYSKLHMIITIIFALLFVIVGCVIGYFAVRKDGDLSLKLIATGMVTVSLYMIVTAFKRMFKKQPELVLDNQGLTTAQTGFLNWDLIFNEKVTRSDQGKRGVKYTLSFQHPGNIVNIDISDFDISKAGLEKLIRVYKGRFNSGIK